MNEPTEKPNSEFDSYRTSYANVVNDSIAFTGLSVDFFVQAKAERLLDVAAEKLGRPATELSFLDVGCGVGTYHPLLAGRVRSVTGVDPSSECIEEARLKNPWVDYSVSTGTTLPFQTGQFDVTYAICVMHHVPVVQWELFVSEMARVTKHGGIVVLFEHNPYNPLTRRAVSTCPFDADAVLLSKRKAEQYLRNSGLNEVTGRYILSIPSKIGALRKLDDALGFAPTGAQYYVVGTA
ncbi:methyltransferase domain-containing protein [Aurantimonas endophytica]|uniref:SAM-dependent methyltransferase n=1 Tax=Aurantimonas endophytica TaxID=1522175 RepID=A0A7W6MPN7_9HYPH|nr:SAM-dependent methyltransferase [Aurantimonas endophytica]MCO6403948.1 methyltransferase domain-containing protein [Aurantimonas endophytica]